MSSQLTPRRSQLYALALVAIALQRRCSRGSLHSLLSYLVRAVGVLALYDGAAIVQRLLLSRANRALPAVDHDAYPMVRERRSSFTITNEHGESRGSLEDVATGGWSWQVNDEPLSTAVSPPKQPIGRLRRSSDSSSSIASSAGTPQQLEAPTLRRRNSNSKVRFKVDSGPSFYGFVFDYSGRCVAHGADERFVGLTLAQVMERSKNLSSDGDGEALHKRFVAAAEAGGGWVSYAWRNSPTAALRLKGAYIIKVGMWGRAFYAGVGYSILPPLEAVAAATAAASAVSTADLDAAAVAAAVAAVPPPRAAVAEATAGLKQKLLTASTRSGLHRLAGDDGLEGGGELAPGDMRLFDKRAAAGGGEGGDDAYPVGGGGGEGGDGGDGGGYWYGGSGGGGGGGLPAELATVLRDHTLMHIGWLQEGRLNGAAAAAGGRGGSVDGEDAPDAAAAPLLSPSVAAQIGYGRRKQSDAPLEGNVAALVGYRRRRNPHVPVQW